MTIPPKMKSFGKERQLFGEYRGGGGYSNSLVATGVGETVVEYKPLVVKFGRPAVSQRAEKEAFP